MSAIVDALLAELDDRALRELAERLRPFLAAEDGWLGTKEAAAYAGCSVHAGPACGEDGRRRLRAAVRRRQDVLPEGRARSMASTPLTYFVKGVYTYLMTQPISPSQREAIIRRDSDRLLEISQLAIRLREAEKALEAQREQLDSRLARSHEEGLTIAALARAAGLSRQSVYEAISRHRRTTGSQSDPEERR